MHPVPAPLSTTLGRPRGGSAWAIVGMLLVVVLGGCEAVETVAVRWTPTSPHADYLAGLHAAGLANSALARDWVAEAASALTEPQGVELPFRETTFIAPDEPDALGYRFTLDRGRRLTVRLSVDSRDDTRVFLDLLRVADDPDGAPRPVLTADTLEDGLAYEPYRAGEYLVRVQPELLRGGSFTLELRTDAALAFPVQDHSTQAIQSYFGAAREGGRRSHHGVDIFAPRGTPVLASRPGEVRRANETRIGGKVVWLRDEAMNRNLYYAHLDSQVVSRGQRVEIGDTLGFVGNTGNAITTPPHLHYGMYVRGEGPVDPLPYLREARSAPPVLAVDAHRLGTWVRVGDGGAEMRQDANRRGGGEGGGRLAPSTPLEILGGNGSWYRVRLPDGTRGYVDADDTESADEPLGRLVTDTELAVTDAPRVGAAMMEWTPPGTVLPVLGRFEEFVWVRSPRGLTGWTLPRTAPSP